MAYDDDSGVRDLLDGGPGKPSWGGKGTDIGETIKGVIVGMRSVQQRTMEGDPKFFAADGSGAARPMMQLEITLQTSMRDPGIDDDDGQRRLFAKGGKKQDAARKGQTMLVAIRQAQTDAKSKVEVGGILAVTYVGEDKAEKGKNGMKLWIASYTPAAIDVDELDG